ncbi:LuxR C-terminal-related transcriptional regulator [Microvirga rosea]|uniref:LuxR C-terminal-related transcriptional regulator n=1 Tax=Microvirga rosea TaxID=2715425 RepID=UPI001D0BC80A|nr:response regulator transcription factor [Microvirga rosea]MCB8823038.1 response regulator transcription factor [Microvirga rosea]
MSQNLSPVTTFLLCRNAMLREGIRHILSSTHYSVQSDYGNEESNSSAPADEKSSLFIIDENLHHAETPSIIYDLKAQSPKAHIVVLADSFDLANMIAIMEAGASGYCLATIACETLVKYLDLVMLGEKVFPAGMVLSQIAEPKVAPSSPRFYDASDIQRMQVVATSLPSRMLSAREAEILHCLMEGAPNKTIARKLEVAEATVKVHVKAILRKIRVTNRTQAAMWAVAHFSNGSQDDQPSLSS